MLSAILWQQRKFQQAPFFAHAKTSTELQLYPKMLLIRLKCGHNGAHAHEIYQAVGSWETPTTGPRAEAALWKITQTLSEKDSFANFKVLVWVAGAYSNSLQGQWPLGAVSLLSFFAVWTENVACHVRKQRMLWPSSPQPLQPPRPCTLRGFRMGKSRILAPDS